jgi:hypothetical protein
MKSRVLQNLNQFKIAVKANKQLRMKNLQTSKPKLQKAELVSILTMK